MSEIMPIFTYNLKAIEHGKKNYAPRAKLLGKHWSLSRRE
jgi:hypothetical protein